MEDKVVMSRIRLRYSTLVNALSAAYRVGVSLLFMIILARKLSVSEFGIWGVIFASTWALSIPVNLWSWWAQRYYARGHPHSLITGLALTLLYWLIGSLFYLGLSRVQASILDVGLYYFVIALPLIPLFTTRTYLVSIMGVLKPEVIGYSNFIYETLRLILAYMLLVEMRLKLVGAILTIEVSTFIAVLYKSFMISRADRFSRFRIDSTILREWIRGFYIPVLNVVASSMRSGVRPFVSWYYRDETPVSYLNIGIASSNPIIGVTQSLVPALYARLLRGTRESKDIEESFRLYLLFSGFMVTTLIVASKPIASLYSIDYIEAYPIIIIMSIYASLASLANMYIQVIQGVDRVDVAGIRSYNILLRSFLFKGALVRIIGIMVAYLSIIIIGILDDARSPIEIAVMASAALLAGIIVMLILSSWLLRILVKYKFPYKTLLHVAISSTVMIFYYKLIGLDRYLVYRFWDDAPLLLIYIVVGGFSYLASMYILSSWFRSLIRAIISSLFSGIIPGRSKYGRL